MPAEISSRPDDAIAAHAIASTRSVVVWCDRIGPIRETPPDDPEPGEIEQVRRPDRSVGPHARQRLEDPMEHRVRAVQDDREHDRGDRRQRIELAGDLDAQERQRRQRHPDRRIEPDPGGAIHARPAATQPAGVLGDRPAPHQAGGEQCGEEHDADQHHDRHVVADGGDHTRPTRHRRCAWRSGSRPSRWRPSTGRSRIAPRSTRC